MRTSGVAANADTHPVWPARSPMHRKVLVEPFVAAAGDGAGVEPLLRLEPERSLRREDQRLIRQSRLPVYMSWVSGHIVTADIPPQCCKHIQLLRWRAYRVVRRFLGVCEAHS